MTQAFNLSQFANKVNTSGQASLTTAVTGTLPVANGGTNNASLAVTAGGTLYTDGTKVVNVGAGTSGEVLTSQGASAPSWQPPQGGFSNIEVFTASGTFTVPAGITKVKVTVVGGGGAGGGFNNTTGTRYGGGGGGVADFKIVTGLTPASNITVTVGAGASGTTANTGGSGGTSSFGAFCSATGGSGGGSAVGTGGNGSNGGLNINGQNAVQDTTYRGGNSLYGWGGLSQSANAIAYGSGGGGAGLTTTAIVRSSGAGGAGFVVVEY